MKRLRNRIERKTIGWFTSRHPAPAEQITLWKCRSNPQYRTPLKGCFRVYIAVPNRYAKKEYDMKVDKDNDEKRDTLPPRPEVRGIRYPCAPTGVIFETSSLL
jgi:hypothetical protein